MFRPRRMDLVEILLLRRDLTVVLKALATARIIHLFHLGTAPEGDRSAGQEAASRLSEYRELAARLLPLAQKLRVEDDAGELLGPEGLVGREEWIESLRAQLGAIRQRQQELRRCRFRLIATALFLRKLSTISGSFERLSNLRISSLQIGLLPKTALYQLSEMPGGCRIYSLARMGKEQRLVAILCLRQREREVSHFLSIMPFVPVPLFHRIKGRFDAVEVRIRKLLARFRHREARLDRKIVELRRSDGKALQDYLYSIRVEIHLLEQERAFNYTRRTVAIAGWVPSRRCKELRRLLEKTCSDRYHIRCNPARTDDTPVLITNPFFVRPFQKILAVYGTPTYREVEPTPLLAFAFVVLFGMMFGDLGHGIALLLAGLGFRRWSRWREEGLILAEVGCSAALFGLLFGSVFGWEGLFAPLWFSPMHDIPRLMEVSLAMGVGLMSAGMVLRVINGLRHEPLSVVLTDRYGLAGIFLYLGSLSLGYLVYLTLVPVQLLTVLLLPLAAVFFHPFFESDGQVSVSMRCAEGIIEVIETVLGFFANTFSFLRVAAFGLAHVGLSMAVYALVEVTNTLPFGIFFAAMIHLFGNLFILVLEGLIVCIQTVRLEFYEFFGKFFRGGGIPFRPLTLDPFMERRV